MKKPTQSPQKTRLSRLQALYGSLKTYHNSKNPRYCWEMQARENQRTPPDPWRTWVIMAGRGFGKTRMGAETVRQWALSGRYRRICLLGQSLEEVRTVMIEGKSGILGVSPPWEGVRYYPSRRCLIWPCGAMASAYSADHYEQLRGPQFDAIWIDELAKFPNGQQAWDQIMMALRLGSHPRIMITTTPRANALLKKLLEDPETVVTRGHTFENAENLSPEYIKNLEKAYKGTRWWQQEVQGHMIQSQEGMLWTPELITYGQPQGPLVRVVVAIDPAVSHKAASDETGIIVAGIDAHGMGYVLDDVSGKYSPTHWVNSAVQAYHHHAGDRIIAEINNGGDVVQHLLHSLHPNIPYRGVHAKRSKHIRAEPVVALYEQKKIFHIRPFPQLEAQMLHPQGVASPDRMDALVWALTELFLSSSNNGPKISVM